MENSTIVLFKKIKRYANAIAIMGYITTIILILMGLFTETIINFITKFSVEETFSHPLINTIRFLLIAILIFIPSLQLSVLAKKIKVYLSKPEELSIDNLLNAIKRFLRYISLIFFISLIAYLVIALSIVYGYTIGI